MGKICIVGIADGKKENITFKAFEKIKNAQKLFLQTCEIPFANQIGIEYFSFDHIYAKATDFDILKASIASELITNSKSNDVVFCGLGDISQNEVVLEIIKQAKKESIDLEFIYGLSCGCENIGNAMAKEELKPKGVKYVSGYSFEIPENTKEGLLIYEVDSQYLASEIKIKLLRVLDGEKQVYIYNEEEKEKKIKLEDLDRQKGYGYSFNVYIPPLELKDKAGFTFLDLLEVVETLRAENGCPWDKEQTHDSLKKFLLEESYEVYDAIKEKDMDMLYDELGDVLLQVVMHGQIGKEHREFDSTDITSAICRKMIFRHPHVFGKVVANTSEEVLINWDKIKEKEKGIESFTHNLKDVPKAMPSLMRSQKVQKRASKCGFDWDDYKLPLEKVHEELDELKHDIEKGLDPKEELGDLLFAVTNLARHLKIEAETALYNGVEKFINRFEDMENLALKNDNRLDNMTLDEMDVLWEQSKKRMKQKANE